MVRLVIRENEADQRLDRFLRKYLKRASLSYIYKIIRKDVKLNGKRSREDAMLSAGDELCIYISEEELKELTLPYQKNTAKKQFKTAYEDDNVLIADKPKGLLTHGDSVEKKNTLVNQVCGYLQEKGEYDPSLEKTFTPAPVNRLDRNTTGLVIFGKNAPALRALTKAIRERDTVEKYYMAIVCGCFREPVYLDDPLEKDREKNVAGVADDTERGKEAATYARPVAAGKEFSLAEIRIFTGRTHQIRVHMAEGGFPLAGDAKYGDAKINAGLKRYGVTTQMLHAFRLRFGSMPEELSELSGKEVEAPLPEEFKRIEDILIDQEISLGMKG